MNGQSGFSWPDGREAALSLTFDDARQSQVDVGIPILDRYGIKATFYVSPRALGDRTEAWKQAAAGGHEIGNHTNSHPCSGNFPFSRNNGLEDYSIERIESDILKANAAIETTLGVKPSTFAYPCGHKYVGRGAGVQSYIPVVARHFLIGRSAFDETHNDPAYVDLAQITGLDSDEASFEKIMVMLERAREERGWLVLFGHDVGDSGRQTTLRDTLTRLGEYLDTPEGKGIWCDTVLTIGSYVSNHRRNPARP